ncbi:hypothetical protein PW52_04750 [Tamlana sedimentorum]|uniref:Right handed beta helix domain-containing protein n=1 Tax=Neotamlana sedimentorum TaxID=1435349 RepID=A0A0D7WFE5_9FLAO|nr:hypothetical protein [Tamlana sedimentorum]KJD36467.1 hypothetical protein PW52_04750 [Tamlana sedimentorum]
MKTKFTFLVTALFAIIIVNAQNVLTVDNSVGANAQYSDIASALSSATAGDTIYVHPSITSYGTVSINKKITLVGFGHLHPEKKTQVEDIILADGASNSKITGFYVYDDIYTANNSETLTNITIENNYIRDHLVFNSGAVDNVIVRGNLIYNIGQGSSSTSYDNFTNTIITNNIITDVIGFKNYDSITIKNNIFLGINSADPIDNAGSGNITIQNCIFYYSTTSTYNPNSTNVVFENCLTYNRGSGNVSTLLGSNNLDNQNPLFIEDTDNAGFNSQTDDFHLQTGSPAIGSGAGGVDIGIYDGTFNFNNYGFTNGIPTVKITDITDRIAPGANLSVTINTIAN